MNGITIPMAIVDFIPVALFFASAVLLQRDLYGRMVKGAYALLAAGSIMVFAGGAYKALWKILYALNVCDYTLLDHSFFPMSGLGFMLTFLALLGQNQYDGRTGKHTASTPEPAPVSSSTASSADSAASWNDKSGNTKLYSAAAPILPAVYASNMPFIILQVLGCAGTQFCLVHYARKRKLYAAVVLFLIAFVFMLGMGYLGAKFDDTSDMHWLAQVTNIISNAAFLAGVVILHKDRGTVPLSSQQKVKA